MILHEDKEFSQLLEKIVGNLGYNIVRNTNKLSAIEEYASEVPGIYLLKCNAKGLQIFDLINRDNNLVIYVTESYDLLSKNIKKFLSQNRIFP